MDATALGDQAEAAAGDFLKHLRSVDPSIDRLSDDTQKLMFYCFASGWVQGRAAGGEEAKAIIRRWNENES